MHVYFCVLFSCCMKLSLPVLCLCCMLVVKKKQKKNDELYFSAHGTRSDILCYIFPRVEHALILFCCISRVVRALALLCYILRVWNTLWRYCVIFYALGKRYSILC